MHSEQPKHIAIIMDGNGRWAQNRGHNRFWGHVRGARVAKSIIEASVGINIRHLTLFAFSTENWHRPKKEVSFLMALLKRQLEREKNTLVKNNVKFNFIGHMERLPSPVRQVILSTIEDTKECDGMILTFAISYSGRQELTNAVKSIADRLSRGEIQAEDINEDLISSSLTSHFLPDPDLIIRTSGEHRLSNFFLWQAAYSEFFVTPEMWPDFTARNLYEAIRFYKTKERRYGLTSEQLKCTSANESTHRPNGRYLKPSPPCHTDKKNSKHWSLL